MSAFKMEKSRKMHRMYGLSRENDSNLWKIKKIYQIIDNFSNSMNVSSSENSKKKSNMENAGIKMSKCDVTQDKSVINKLFSFAKITSQTTI
jgi:hypothetical protein